MFLLWAYFNQRNRLIFSAFEKVHFPKDTDEILITFGHFNQTGVKNVSKKNIRLKWVLNGMKSIFLGTIEAKKPFFAIKFGTQISNGESVMKNTN